MPPSGYGYWPSPGTILMNRASGFGMVPFASGINGCEVGAPLPVNGAEAQYWGDPETDPFTVPDRSGNAYTPTVVSGTAPGYTPMETTPPNGGESYGGMAIYDHLTTGVPIIEYVDAAGDLRFLNEVTIQCMVCPAGQGPLVVYGGNGTGGTSASNLAYEVISESLAQQYRIQFRWQHGNNVNVIVEPTIVIEEGSWNLITCVRRDDGATCTAEIWYHDILVVTTSGLTKPTGATSRGLAVYSDFSPGNSMEGGLGQIRIWDTARSATDIAADAACVVPQRRQPV